MSRRLACVCAAVVCAAVAGGRALGQEPAAGPAPDPVPRRTLADYDVIRIKNPFSPDPPKAPEVAKPSAPAPPTEPAKPAPPPKQVPKQNTVLTGLFAGRGEVTAMVERDGQPRTLRMGDEFLGGRVSLIELDRLVVQVGDSEREFRPGERFADGTEMVNEGAEAPAPAAASPAKPGGVTAFLTDEERATLTKEQQVALIRQRMKENRERQGK